MATSQIPQTVLLTGGTGLIGRRLELALRDRGHTVRIVSRTRGDVHWDPTKAYLAPDALDGVDAIIHLAGAGVADQRWTNTRKQAIIDSRIETTRILEDALTAKPDHTVKTFLCASAVGFYGSRGDEKLTESSESGDDFLAQVSLAWESAADRLGDLGLRVAKMRIGIVLSQRGGALPELTKTLPLGIAGVLGNGKQWYPVIHVDDLARMFVFALENTAIQGPYNAVGPAPIRQRDLMRAILQASGRKAIMTPVPTFGLRVMLGEMMAAVMMSSRASSSKIERAGFRFDYPTVERQLEALYAG